MGLTFTTNPTQKETAYRSIVYKVTSDSPTIIRVIADLYINGTYKTSIEKSPNISTSNVFSFDVSTLLQDYLSGIVPAWTASAHTLYDDTLSSLEYDVIFYEVLDNGTTYDTTWSEDGTGSPSDLSSTSLNTEHYAYNMTFNHEDSNDITVFQKGQTYGSVSKGHGATTTYDGKITDPAKKIKRGDFLPVNCYSTGGGAHFGRYITYDNTDTIISTNNSSTQALTNFRGTYVVDTSLAESNAVKMLAIVILASSGQTDYLNYDIVEDCNDYVSLYWYNSAGGIDYYLFRDTNIKSTEGDTTTYKQPLSTSYNSYDFGTTVLRKEGVIGHKLVSEALSRADAKWLSELTTHGITAWIFESGNFIPVVIADSNIRTIDSTNGIYRAEIDLIYSNKQITQQF